MNSQSVFALDTGTVIKILRRTPDPVAFAKFSEAVVNGADIVVPQFVHFEMLRGYSYANAIARELAYRKFLTKYSIGRFGDNTWEIAAKLYSDLRKGGWNISDSDILIGAFCIENNYTLVTTNVKHFKSMANLKVINWTQ
jgi:predicted nucleic acid-binding protein